jgi:hypothetical protein
MILLYVIGMSSWAPTFVSKERLCDVLLLGIPAISSFMSDLELSLEDAYARSGETAAKPVVEADRRSKFKPISQSQAEVKVKYVRGPDGKLKRKIKRKKGDDARPPKLEAVESKSLEQVDAILEKSDDVSPRGKDDRQSSQFERKKFETERQLDSGESLALESGEALSRPSDVRNETTELKGNSKSDRQPVKEANSVDQPSAAEADIFSDEDSDYDPFAERSDDESCETTSIKPGTVFKDIEELDSKPKVSNSGIIEALKAASDRMVEPRKEKTLPQVEMGDGYDIEEYMGGEGTWDDEHDDNDDEKSRKSKRRRKKR